MHQLALDLAERPRPSWTNFMPGPNGDAVQALQSGLGVTSAVPSIYLWGPPGAGKSHLLSAYVEQHSGVLLNTASTADEFDRAQGIVAVDDCDSLNAEQQERAFHLYNRLREAGGRLLAAGHAAPLHLNVREDFRTRLGWGLVFQLEPIGDAEKSAALAQLALQRGLRMSDDVVPYMLTRFERDMRRLTALIDALDRYSLEHQRAVTVPLLKELFKELSNEPRAV